VGRGRKLHGDQRTAAGQTLHAGVAHLPQVPRPGGIRTHVPDLHPAERDGVPGVLQISP